MTKSLPPKSLVLYADDDPDDVALVREAFEEYSRSIQLVAFKSGFELLAYIKKLEPLEPLPCLIILDINMPALNGKDVLQKLKNTEGFKEVPVVLFSTSTLPSEAAFAKSFDAGFVTKPLHRKQIYQLVDQMLEHCTEETRRNIKRFRER